MELPKGLFNYNVVLALLFRAIDNAGQGIWNNATLTAYIYLLEDAGWAVGLVQGIQGTLMAVAALPAGWLADRMRRDTVLRVQSVVGLAAAAMTAASLLVPNTVIHITDSWTVNSKFLVLCFAMALWGIEMGSNPVVEALFADSSPAGSRSILYTILYSITVVSTALGPALAAFFFAFHGNVWTLSSLGPIILGGLAVSLVAAIILFLFNDDKALGEESEGKLAEKKEPLLKEVDETGVKPDGAVVAADEKKWGFLTVGSIPYIMVSADLIFGLASGMTIKFFPIFFMEAVELDPMNTNALLAVTPIVLSLTSFLCQYLSRHIGRVQSAFVFKAIGVVLVAWMGLQRSIWKVKWLIVLVYIIRTAVMNAPYPVQRSVLMDYVPKEDRAKWSSLESIISFGWSGSAVIGGILLDKFGFGPTFIITAIIQAIGTLMFILLMPIVPIKEGQGENMDVTEGDDVFLQRVRSRRDEEAIEAVQYLSNASAMQQSFTRAVAGI